MAKSIEIKHGDGSETKFSSTIFRGYHLKEAADGVCVTEKTFFSDERLVACFPNATAKQQRCGFCEQVNPTQRPEQ